MARLSLTRPRSFGIGLVVASFAFAACGGHSSTPTPTTTASAAPTPTSSAPVSLESPCASSLGIAYEPDGGNGNGFNGIQVTHFEDNSENLCGSVTASSATSTITLDSSASAIAFAQDLSDSVALLYNGSSGGYSYAQDIFGAAVGQLVPVGTPYNLSVAPTPVPPVPSASPTTAASPTASPALISDGTSISILNDGTAAVALVVSPNTVPQSIVALTSLGDAPPQYGNAVPFSSPNYTLQTPYGTSFSNIRALTDSAGHMNVLVRGLNDLIVVGVSNVASGYQFNVQAEDKNLGSYVPLRGYGRMAFSPTDATRALVAGTSSGSVNTLTLVTGMPSAITESSSILIPGSITSVAISPFGTYAAVGTTSGIAIVGGISSAPLTILTPFSGSQLYAPTFTNCNGGQSTLTNIISVGFSADAKYLVALGTPSTPVSCASGRNATLIAVPFLGGTGATPAPSSLPTPTAAPSGSPSPSPIPTFLQQNNVIAPPTGADYLFVH